MCCEKCLIDQLLRGRNLSPCNYQPGMIIRPDNHLSSYSFLPPNREHNVLFLKDERQQLIQECKLIWSQGGPQDQEL